MRNAITLVLALTVTLVAGVLSGGTAQAFSGSITVTPVEITSFEWVSGREQWKQGYYQRLRRSSFTLSSNGAFVMHLPDGYGTLSGRLSEDGSFHATDNKSYGSTGSSTAEVSGQVGMNGSTPILSLTYTAGQVMAANVNNTSFGMNSSLAYRATMTVQQD